VELLANVGHVESRFDLFGDSVIWMHPMELLDDVDHLECRFGPLGDSVCFGAK
jgi:hypothetical protein